MTTALYDADRLEQTARRCGECTLCCKLTPVHSINKPANTRCQHQRMGKGCAIYAKRPRDCRLWSCRWLAHDDTAGLSRPDRSHYVIDIMPDYVTSIDHGSGRRTNIPVIQVWIDPLYPYAHRDPALRRYLALVAERDGMAAIIRSGSEEGFVIFAPAISSDGQWHEQDGVSLGREHTAAEKLAVLDEETTSKLTVELQLGDIAVDAADAVRKAEGEPWPKTKTVDRSAS